MPCQQTCASILKACHLPLHPIPCSPCEAKQATSHRATCCTSCKHLRCKHCQAHQQPWRQPWHRRYAAAGRPAPQQPSSNPARVCSCRKQQQDHALRRHIISGCCSGWGGMQAAVPSDISRCVLHLHSFHSEAFSLLPPCSHKCMQHSMQPAPSQLYEQHAADSSCHQTAAVAGAWLVCRSSRPVWPLPQSSVHCHLSDDLLRHQQQGWVTHPAVRVMWYVRSLLCCCQEPSRRCCLWGTGR